MNCHQFQDKLYEYVEGSLRAEAQADADKHLAGCAACRQRVQQEQEMARSLSEGFQRATAGLELPVEVGRRVLAAVAAEWEHPTSNIQHPTSRGVPWGVDWMLGVRCWLLDVCKMSRLAGPAALAATAAVLVAGLVLLTPLSRPLRGDSQPRLARGGISVQFSFVAPVYTFHHEDGFVVDALTSQTTEINERLQPDVASLH
jgi:anti-sigma factor RsiW